MSIKIYRTNEIEEEIWKEICRGYEECFDIKRTPEQLKQSFSKSITGYSLHAIKYDNEGNIMGHNYYQPRPYLLNGEKIVCALSGGTFVFPEYRNDIFIFKDMVKALDKEAIRLGWAALLGIPNENSFKYAVKINKQKHIGDLSYYIFPIHAGKILNIKNSLMNFLSSMFCSISLKANRLLSLFWNPREKKKSLSLDVTEDYLNIRFDWDYYSHIQKDDFQGVYRVYDEHGVRTAYILHFGENNIRTYKSLCRVTKEILKNEKIDAIIYIGTLNFPQGLFFKVPKRNEPQKLPLCVTILDKNNSDLKKALTSLDNIDFGLINFDVR